MQVQATLVTLTSRDRRWLYEWYRDVLELPQARNRGGLALAAAGTTLVFDGHRGVPGRVCEPARIVLDLFVANVKAETRRLEAEEVECIERLKPEPRRGLVSTFVDPDGNHVRLIERASSGNSEPTATGAPAASLLTRGVSNAADSVRAPDRRVSGAAR